MLCSDSKSEARHGLQDQRFNGAGAAVSVIVETAEEALAKIAQYRENGFSDIAVRDMHGLDVDPEDLER